MHLDPNTPRDMPDPIFWGDLLNDRTFLLMTLGCNANGQKRGLDINERMPWFDYVDTVMVWLPHRFDTTFLSLKGDKHQWAYLAVMPRKWIRRPDLWANQLRKEAERTLPHPLGELEMYHWREDPIGFSACVRRHFLTAKELGESS
jgi:hypothetical protein